MPNQLGIDEAGRGPVLGPLVLAGLQVESSQLPQLKSLNIQDSKLFGSSAKGKKEREDIYKCLIQDFLHHIEVIEPATIDQYIQHGPGLNRLEQDSAQKIINQLPSDQVILDGANLFKPLCKEGIIAINKADRDHLSVAGASIIAKVIRDQEVERLTQPFEKEFGKITGGGYPNQGTLKFVQWHLHTKGELPSFYRKSYQWKALTNQE